MNPFARYARWLHTRWPAGLVEKLPVVGENGSTNLPGVFVVGDLRGVPLLKLAADSGARAVRTIAEDPAFRADRATPEAGVLDLVIVGGGVSGMAAALEARARRLDFRVLEAAEPFSTIVNFPKAKPIYTYPAEMDPEGILRVRASVKEDLLAELRAQTAGLSTTPGRAERVRRAGKRLEVAVEGGPALRARRVLVALGRSGNFRRLGVPGEDLDKVYNRLHDPKDHAGKQALVVGGGDSALETAIALAEAGARVTLCHRGRTLSRPKPDNVERAEALGGERLRLETGATVREIRAADVVLARADGSTAALPNDVVFAMIGREAPLDFFRRSGIALAGERTPAFWATFALAAAAFAFLYHWKSGGALTGWFQDRGLFPFHAPPGDPRTLGGTIRASFAAPGAWYTLAYTLAIAGFGIRRIRRRRTPYVTAQTSVLIAVQAVPLFLLPYVLLPWIGNTGGFGGRHRVVPVPDAAAATWRDLGAVHGDDPAAFAAAARAAGVLPAGTESWPDLAAETSWRHRTEGDRVILRSAPEGAPVREAVLRLSDRRAHLRDEGEASSRTADALFPASEWDPQGREYWRAFGLVLAWPLFLWNVFTHQPMGAWLVLSAVQTLVIIPWIVLRWGKGAYCGWICSCGALAETMGDAHRHKMPHGPVWNRLNLAGQGILALATALLLLRVAAWAFPGNRLAQDAYAILLTGRTAGGAALPFPVTLLNYRWLVDLFLAGIVGTGFYFHFSGRVWCRFACPLAAWMHVVARFSRFRILADKKKCISCNVCTSVCHQGIDVMSFANKGLPMEDPECVRCSACVQSCPTGVLSFGGVDPRTGAVIGTDRLAASALALRDAAVRGAPVR
jgi:thioredoxin reductase/ferredoxin